MKTEYLVLHEDRGVSLTAYLQEVGGEFLGLSARPAVLILPGGGYHFCSEREADPVAYPYLKAGYQAFILRYSLNEHARWPNPLEDYERAMALIRAKAEAWHVVPDRIAVIGFSAGGHLAACAATMSKNRPNAAILGYPVIDRDCVRSYAGDAPDAAEAVDGSTCPCFVFATRTDNLVPAENSLHFINALWANEIAFESHIYSNGPHGLSTGDGSFNPMNFCPRYPAWVQDSITWLEDMLGGFGADGLHKPRFGARINGNREKTLNLDCTLAWLRRFPAAQEILRELLPGGELGDGMPQAFEKVSTIGDTLRYMRADAATMERIERRLREIENSWEG